MISTPESIEIERFESYLSIGLINECITQLRQKPQATYLKIVAKSKVERVDILCIAYLILLKKRRKINVSLYLIENSRYYEERVYSLVHYIRHAKLVTGISELIDLYYGKDQSQLRDDEPIVSSDTFMPCLYFEGGQMKDDLFSKIAKFPKISPDEYVTDANALHSAIKKNIKAKHSDSVGALDELFFNEALNNLKILTSYHKPADSNEKPRTGSFNDPQYYYEAVRELLSEEGNDIHLGNRMNLMIFTLLSNGILRNIPPDPKQDELNRNSATMLRITKNLWYFTKEFVHGINELAQNIIDHTISKKGVITGRLYSKNQISEFYNTGENAFVDRYFEDIEKEHENAITHYLVVNVIDDNPIGVISQLKNNIGKDLLTDVDGTRTGEITFKDLLLSPTSRLKPFQVKRSVAHLGLLIFSRLVRENNGMIIASTEAETSSNLPRTAVVVYGNSTLEIPYAQAPCIGTNYSIIIPVIPADKHEINPYIPSIKERINSVELHNIEGLLKYSLKDISCQDLKINTLPEEQFPISRSTESPCELSFMGPQIFNFTGSKISNVIPNAGEEPEDQLWHLIESHMPSSFISRLNCFASIDFETIEINESQLFRFLGKWEEMYPSRSLILYNIKTKLYLEFIRLLTSLGDEIFSKFWSRVSMIIFYNYISIDSESRFYFTDAIWGDNKSDFRFMNKILYNTSYNATQLYFQDEQDWEEKVDDRIFDLDEIKSLNVFEQGNLRPFDLMLKAPGGITLFEQNAYVLLNRELMK